MHLRGGIHLIFPVGNASLTSKPKILTGKAPFEDINSNNGHPVFWQIYEALRDSRQPYALDTITAEFPDFAFLAECLDPDPFRRPTIATVCERMGWK